MANQIIILRKIKECVLSDFDNKSAFTNKNEGKKMAILLTKELHCRDIGNLGRQESEDLYIGVDEKGWVKYQHTVSYFAGPLKIMNPVEIRLDEQSVIDFLNSEACSEDDFLEFWDSACKLVK